MYCAKCGKEVKEGTRFCGSCGSVVSADVITNTQYGGTQTQANPANQPAQSAMPNYGNSVGPYAQTGSFGAKMGSFGSMPYSNIFKEYMPVMFQYTAIFILGAFLIYFLYISLSNTVLDSY